MVDQSDIEIVETTEDYYRFQLQGRDQFDEIAETPHWAQEAAETVSDGTTVRMGRVPDTDTLRIESVEVPRKPNLGQEGAKDVAEKVVEEIRS